MRLAELWASVALTCVLAHGCTRQPKESEGRNTALFQRGDRVLVESSAAKFYEAQVVGIEGSKLRVQAVPSGDAAVVPISDVYRLPAKPVQLDHLALAICSSQKERWFGCRIMSSDASGVEVLDIDELRYRITWNHVVQPNALTELNLKRLFDKASEQRDFEQELAHAGDPKTIPGWRPLPGKSVLARIDGKWWLAVVASEKKGKVRVKFPGSERQLDVDRADVAAEPPYALESSEKSRFALLRPTNPNQAWNPVRLISVDALEAVVESAGSNRRTVPVRDVCPLEFSPAKSAP